LLLDELLEDVFEDLEKKTPLLNEFPHVPCRLLVSPEKSSDEDAGSDVLSAEG
jgi:hypothetical protein